MAIIFFFLSSLFAGQFNIDEYVKKSLDLSYSVKEYQENLDIAKSEYISSFSSMYMPSAYYSLSDIPYSDAKTRFSLSTRDMDSQLSLSYKLFNNFYDSIDLKVAFLLRKQAEMNLWLKKQDVAFTAMNKYCNVLKNKKILDVMKVQEKSYQDEYEKSKQYYKEGLRSYSDLLKSELNFKNAQLSSVYYENVYKNSMMDLNYAIYLDPLEKFELSEIVFDENLKEGMEEAVDYAIKNRKELKISENNIKIKELEFKKKYIGLFPKFSADLGYSRSEMFSIGNSSLKNNSYFLKLSMIYTFGNEIFSKNKEYVSSKIYLEREKRNIEELKLSIKKEVISLFLDLNYSFKKYEVSKSNAEISKTNLEIIKQKYSEGKASIIDLIEAQKDDMSAQSNLAESYYNLYLKKAELDKAMGKEIWR